MSALPQVATLPNAVGAALFAGVVAGTLDIFAAALINRARPSKVLRAIASGLLGKAAFTGSRSVPALGFALQLSMCILIALFYSLAALRIASLIKHPWPWGLAFGAGVFGVMNGIVVPLSRVPRRPRVTVSWALMNLAVMLGFGALVAILVTAWFSAASA